MIISPFYTVLLALPVLLLGEWLVRRVNFFARFNIPAPVVGGLLVSVVVLVLNVSGASAVQLGSKVTAAAWTWLVTIEPEWVNRPAQPVGLPLLVGFFTCIGLNSTWDIVRRGSVQLVIFLALSTLLGVVQNVVGVALAKTLGLHPLMGLVCGSITLAGGHATAIGFTPQLEAGGLVGAGVMGAAAATTGLVLGGLMGGPIGGLLIRRHRLKPEPATEAGPGGAGAVEKNAIRNVAAHPSGILWDFRTLGAMGLPVCKHVLVLLGCIKAGVWVSYYLQKTGITFPVHIGAMVVGMALRNALDFAGWRWIRTDVIAALSSVLLGFFLTIAMMGLNLRDLANVALPMLFIICVQVVVMALFAAWVTFRIMGRDYEAAVMCAGQCGFGIGNTSNAIASMQSLVERYGLAPRAFLIVPLVGAMLGDLTNALNVTLFLNLLK